ncbi:uncharacterized protein A1O5_13188 [Cladophialophora psammophila CBS 110553]|uniref:Uncharacterized protein n=1 Tax=Cladophialophora psammophila CBS 110553 TaxID=1182543 RepID=W9VNB3_9EURO|nr:uncharacterized protein A1O5_13188 [Cladophialophora psammophila CBS 110553]EXJ53621.1 hypothetical protein A1O5_13188 [Cladophialophora psammophila CBS 110553]
MLVLPRAAQPTALPPSEPVDSTDQVRNANHIFNAVHSSMRQWGSSIYHNGMSFFPALVPAGIQFYHGNPNQEPVQGLEWLAFEPEHAIIFARRFHRPYEALLPQTGKGTEIMNQPSFERISSSALKAAKFSPNSMTESHDRHSILERPDIPQVDPGWLHTYRTKEATPLLYIDGMSAGKCDKGTLDSQDVLLLNASSDGGGMLWERKRADGLCKLAYERWNGKIKGFIRMEAGFEIIMCSFSDSLDFVQSVRAGQLSPEGAAPDTSEKSFDWAIWKWIKFVAARYDGIGGRRVRLDYDHFFTAYTYDFDLFSGETDLPRLENTSAVALDRARDDVDKMVRSWDPLNTLDEKSQVDWQSITDMVVERYAGVLKYLLGGKLTKVEDLLEELELILRVFIDSDARNKTAEVDRCVAQFNPVEGRISTSIVGGSIRAVTREICETLFAAFNADVTLSQAMDKLRSLTKYLDWSVWKKCPQCAFNEVCFIPMWPFGTAEDREHPRCRNSSESSGRMGYWGNPRSRWN